MPRKLLKRIMPDHKKMHEHPHLKKFGHRLTEPRLWHLNRRTIALGVALGLFIGFMPVFGQMFIAAGLAIFLRVNLPIAVVSTWISNPITAVPLYFFSYEVGAGILQLPTEAHAFNLSIEWFTHEFLIIWQPLLLGCIICGLIAAILGIIFVRLFWRLMVIRNWLKRKRKKVAA